MTANVSSTCALHTWRHRCQKGIQYVGSAVRKARLFGEFDTVSAREDQSVAARGRNIDKDDGPRREVIRRYEIRKGFGSQEVVEASAAAGVF